jgi:formyltetrahydrofolate deformylase
MSNPTRYILTTTCPDAANIVASVASFISAQDAFINELTQYGDQVSGNFFLRMDFSIGGKTPDKDTLREAFQRVVATPYQMEWHMRDAERKQRAVILVSKFGHCLNDILHRFKTGSLPVDIPSVISNHDEMRSMTEWHGVPYHHLPVTADDKAQQEEKLWAIIEENEADVVVLARYMQILSPELSAKLAGKAINIHHSFLPSFKGAKPYHQAHARGVKIIGATAHYVTDALDEGPIIEQEIARVDHAHTPEQLVAMGRDIESQVLARALTYHVEHRVLLNGNKTVVFK